MIRVHQDRTIALADTGMTASAHAIQTVTTEVAMQATVAGHLALPLAVTITVPRVGLAGAIHGVAGAHHVPQEIAAVMVPRAGPDEVNRVRVEAHRVRHDVTTDSRRSGSR